MKYIIAIAITCSFLFAWDKAFSQELTTGNLLPNSGNGRDWNSNSTDIINSGSSGYVSNGSTVDGFTVTCDAGQAALAKKIAEEKAKLETLKRQEEIDNIIITETDLETKEIKAINVHK